MRRLADFYLNQAPTLDEMKKAHRTFIRDYNSQIHFAHREREVRRHSPKAGAARHAGADPPSANAGPHLLCHRVYALPGPLRLYPFSELSLLRRGRTGQAASAGQHLHQHAAAIAYQDTELALYTTGWAQDNTHITQVKNPRLIETGYQSPLVKLWTLGPDEWLLFLKLPDYAARKKPKGTPHVIQFPLPDMAEPEQQAI